MKIREASFVNTTLCYIRSAGQTLLIRRTKSGSLHGKWIVPGGKFEAGETPEECVCREVEEETGLKLAEINLRGIITFVQHPAETEIRTYTCFVFESYAFAGPLLPHSSEGEIHWVPDGQIAGLDIPPADRIFLPWIYENKRFFSAKFSAGLKDVTFYG